VDLNDTTVGSEFARQTADEFIDRFQTIVADMNATDQAARKAAAI